MAALTLEAVGSGSTQTRRPSGRLMAGPYPRRLPSMSFVEAPVFLEVPLVSVSPARGITARRP
jgi:hypothetical protein